MLWWRGHKEGTEGLKPCSCWCWLGAGRGWKEHGEVVRSEESLREGRERGARSGITQRGRRWRSIKKKKKSDRGRKP